jgi:hypothetical protein
VVAAGLPEEFAELPRTGGKPAAVSAAQGARAAKPRAGLLQRIRTRS